MRGLPHFFSEDVGNADVPFAAKVLGAEVEVSNAGPGVIEAGAEGQGGAPNVILPCLSFEAVPGPSLGRGVDEVGHSGL